MTRIIHRPNSHSLPLNNNEARYNVRRIICIGRNYAEHAKEMGHNPSEAPPFFFYKPLTALCDASEPINWTLPAYSQNVHYELEVAIAIGKKTTSNNPEQAIFACGLSLDMTCRDTQQQAKAAGRPWATAKGFDHSAPCSALHTISWEELKHLGDFTLYKNQQQVQQGNVNQMVWPIPELLIELSKYTQLDDGDLILTGTPAGVGPVVEGDQLEAKIDGLPCTMTINIQQ